MRVPPRRMHVVPEPKPSEGRTIVASQVAPAVIGTGTSAGDVSYMCGSCGTILILTVGEGAVMLIVFKCPVCGSFNETEPTDADPPTKPERPN